MVLQEGQIGAARPLQMPIFTVGHSNLQIEDFITIMMRYHIEIIADIRRAPHSRHNPQFNEDSLRLCLKQQAIDYIHMAELGGLRPPLKDSPNSGWRNKNFRGYADYMQTKAFHDNLQLLIALSRTKPTAIMCAEAVPWRCHRSLVADALYVRAIPVIEILSQTIHRDHKITPFACVDGSKITYPPRQPSLF